MLSVPAESAFANDSQVRFCAQILLDSACDLVAELALRQALRYDPLAALSLGE